LAVVGAKRIASAKVTRNLADHLTAEWWKWAMQDPALEKNAKGSI
jgi:hypothetical protein